MEEMVKVRCGWLRCRNGFVWLVDGQRGFGCKTRLWEHCRRKSTSFDVPQ